MNNTTLSHIWQALQALKGSEDLQKARFIDTAHVIAHLEAALDAAHTSHNDLALVMIQPCLLGQTEGTPTRGRAT